MTPETVTAPLRRADAADGVAGLALRAWAIASAPVVLGVVVVLALVGVREGRVDDVLVGAALVVGAGLVGAFLKARAVRGAATGGTGPVVGMQAATRLQLALAADFVLLLVAFAAGLALMLRERGWKFVDLEEFGFTFAGAGLIFLLASSATIAQDSARRGTRPGAASDASSQHRPSEDTEA